MQRGPRGPYVFVIAADDTARRQAITTGYEDERASIVTEGLKGGERVVIDGASRLSDGSKITVASSATEGQTAPSDQPAAPGTRRTRAPG